MRDTLSYEEITFNQIFIRDHLFFSQIVLPKFALVV